MMSEQPAIETGKDLLFLLTGPWVNEAGEHRLCADCCTLEGALQVNPHWAEAVTLVRVEYPRPRPEAIGGGFLLLSAARLGVDGRWFGAVWCQAGVDSSWPEP